MVPGSGQLGAPDALAFWRFIKHIELIQLLQLSKIIPLFPRRKSK
jgi:hypothetical protein